METVRFSNYLNYFLVVELHYFTLGGVIYLLNLTKSNPELQPTHFISDSLYDVMRLIHISACILWERKVSAFHFILSSIRFSKRV